MSLFLKQTLTRVKLHEILATRPVAVNHLVTYLQKRKSYQELSDLLTSSGRYDEAGVVLYQHALTLKGADERVRRIKGNFNSINFSTQCRKTRAKSLVSSYNRAKNLRSTLKF